MNTDQTVIYLASPNIDETSANHLAKQSGASEALAIGRRGYHVGWIAEQTSKLPVLSTPPGDSLKAQWQAMGPIVLNQFFKSDIDRFQAQINQAQSLSENILDDIPCDELLSEEPYASRLSPKFELLATSCNEADNQEIETLDFDVMNGDEVVAENLWVKLSWLSFMEEDSSLRFRFSFGMPGYEDVAADYARQCYAAELTEAIFPHSSIISDNKALQSLLCNTLNVKQVDYVERIIYFNAPHGGAQFHQDVERGHSGVVFAQMYGRTAWLALAKQQLIEEIIEFITTEGAEANYLATVNDTPAWQILLEMSKDRGKLNTFLDEFDNEPVESLINRVPEFTNQLINKGFSFILNPGDVILLPQHDKDNCCWHSVFCLDSHPGQALSFAIRATPQ